LGSEEGVVDGVGVEVVGRGGGEVIEVSVVEAGSGGGGGGSGSGSDGDGGEGDVPPLFVIATELAKICSYSLIIMNTTSLLLSFKPFKKSNSFGLNSISINSKPNSLLSLFFLFSQVSNI
jgi:hypothetical protein